MNLEDFLNEAKKMGYEDFQYKSEAFPGGRLETFFLGMPENAPKLPQEEVSVSKSDNMYPGWVLPPKEGFIFNLRYLLDLAHATKGERSLMEDLINRFDGKAKDGGRRPSGDARGVSGKVDRKTRGLPRRDKSSPFHP